MKIRIFAFFTIFLLLFAGCKQDKVQKDLIDYYNNGLSSLAVEEGDAVNTFHSVTGANYKDDQTLYDAMKNTVLPKYEEFMKKLEALNPQTDEVKELHKVYLDGAEKQYQGFLHVVEALEKQDAALIEQANGELNAGSEVIGRFNTMLDELLEKHDVEIKDKE